MPKAHSADMCERVIAEVEGEASPAPTRSSTERLRDQLEQEIAEAVTTS